MRYAIVSDIHGNLPAWNTVLADAALHRAGAVVCLGDVVGYGPQPAEVLRSVHAKCAAIVLGNHDAVVCGRMAASVFNDRARRGIEWTGRRLGAAARSLFSRLPLALAGPEVRFTHGSPADPAAFGYVRTPEDAAAAFRAVPEQLLFCGHTHVPALFVVGESGVARETEPRDFELEPGKRYLVNVGSVGSPRGGDPRASYAIYDDETRAVYFHRVSFDLAAFRSAVASASSGPDPLSPDDVPFFAAASGSEMGDVREETDFSPSPGSRAALGDAPGEARLEALSRRATRRMRAAAVFAAAGVAAVAVAAVLGARALRGPGVSYPDSPLDPVPLSEKGGPDGNLLPVFAPSQNGPFLCLPYRVDLGNARRQSVRADDMWRLELRSDDSTRPARVCAPPVECRAGQKFEAFARVRFSADFRGSFEMAATLERDDGRTETLFTRSFTAAQPGIADAALPTTIRALKRSDGWLLARGTSRDELPAGASAVRLEVGGNFTGTVTVGAVAARRR